MDITKSYGLDRMWINAEVAERLGIADGDEVILSNTMAEGPIKVKVTAAHQPDGHLHALATMAASLARSAHGLRRWLELHGLRSLPHGTGLWLGHARRRRWFPCKKVGE